MLQSKAQASKALTKWLEVRALQHASRADASEADRVMCICICSYSAMIRLMKHADHIFTQQQALTFKDLVLRHLNSYTWLHKRGMEIRNKHEPGKHCYILMPKMHHLYHLAMDTALHRLNPVSHQLMSAESFIGIVGRISRACHRSSLSLRTLERYLCKLYIKIKDLEAG